MSQAFRPRPSPTRPAVGRWGAGWGVREVCARVGLVEDRAADRDGTPAGLVQLGLGGAGPRPRRGPAAAGAARARWPGARPAGWGAGAPRIFGSKAAVRVYDFLPATQRDELLAGAAAGGVLLVPRWATPARGLARCCPPAALGLGRPPRPPLPPLALRLALLAVPTPRVRRQRASWAAGAAAAPPSTPISGPAAWPPRAGWELG
jgi:hypothetical protein